MKSKIYCQVMIFLFAIITTLNLVSCTQDLIPEPTMEKITSGTSSSSSLLPPSQVTATHGGYKSVTLTWKETSNANQYKIYSAKTPYDTFTQVAETKDNGTQITISEESGTTKYYRVSTVDYQKNESSLSDFVFGSSLATPIITSIEQSEEGTEATVHWWMENCNNDTYLKSVKYEVVVCDTEKKEVARYGLAGQSEDPRVLQSVTEYTVTGLLPKTVYFFKVEAHTIQNNDKKEISDMVDAETARRLTPNAPENLTITQGTAADGITVSWTLPEFTDVTTSSGTYERHPIYFTVERKLKGASDKTYEKIAEKVSSCASENLAKKIYHFDCANPAASSAILTVDPSTDEKSETNANYPKYISGSIISFTDTDSKLERNSQYEYRVQSFVDDTKKTISSNNSVVSETGWLTSVLAFSITPSYKYNDDKTLFKNVEISCKVSFEDFGTKNVYSYILEQTYTSFDEIPVIISSKNLQTYSLETLNNHKISFDFENDTPKEGFYTYKLYVANFSETDIPAVYYTAVETLNSVTVTKDPSHLPNLDHFTVSDGFASKYDLSFDYNKNYVYTIKWDSFDTNGSIISSESTTLSEADISSGIITKEGSGENEWQKITISIPAEVNEIRKFTIKAESGLSTEKSLDDKYYTMGKPVVTLTEYDYSKIKVTWPKVQYAKADPSNFSVKALYKDQTIFQDDDNYKTDLASGSTVTWDDESQLYSCEIVSPYGYDNAKISGLPIELSVTAESSKTSDKTISTSEVKTVGPALIKTTVADNATANDSISISWEEVDGAAGYIIQRILYADAKGTTPSEHDKYYYSISDNKITVNMVDANDSQVKITKIGNIYKFTDFAKVTPETSNYNIHQSKISWGLPFGYIVIPVKNGGSSDDFEFDLTTLLDNSKGTPKYTALNTVKAATFGYGLNIIADKSCDGSRQFISWIKPYYETNKPYLYRRIAGSTENTWELFSGESIAKDDTSCKPEISTEERSSAFEYIIKYANSKPNVILTDEIPVSYINHLSTLTGDRYDDSCSEQKNKGYLLYPESFSAKTSGKTDKTDKNYYSETVLWDNWNYSKREIGPESFKIEIFNNNLASGWNTIVNAADKNLCYTTSAEGVIAKDGETTLIADGTSLILNPSKIVSGTATYTNGFLKVLRDPKHYYRMILSRKDPSEPTNTITSYAGSDYTVYGYRQITDEELVKAAMLAFSYGFFIHDGGETTYNNVGNQFNYNNAGTISSANNGSMSFTKGSYQASGKYKATYSALNYTPAMLGPGKLTEPFLSITSNSESNNQFRIKGTFDYYLFEFEGTNILDITLGNKDLNINYDAQLTFTAPDNNSFTLAITRNGSTKSLINTTDNATRKKWFPMQIHSDKKYEITSSDYGWWPSKSD